MTKTTRGQRFYMVRLAAGDGVRKPEPLKAFVERIARQTGFVIHASELSEIENDKPSKAVTAEHIEAVAAVDPAQRGRDWLGWDGPITSPSAPYHVPVDIIEPLDVLDELEREAKEKAARAKGGQQKGKRAS